MRSAHPGAVPIVELRSAPFPTRFGMKSKPCFKVIGWKSAGGDKSAPTEKLLTVKQADKAVADSVKINDEIPF